MEVWTMKEILVATDGSPAAREAAEMAIDLAAEHGARVRFLRVVATDWTATRMGPVRPAARPLGGEDDDPVLKDARGRAEERGIDTTVARVAGEPAKAITAYADKVDADLLVLGSRGLGPATGALRGSVSHAVLKRLKRPVLVVPTRPEGVARAA
jgi:nucleotide-binding universal stress UspA family protein